MLTSEQAYPDFNFGENLKKIRIKKGISQYAMANCLKISQASYSRLEAHAGLPAMDLLVQIAKEIDTPIECLLPPHAIANDTKEFTKTRAGLIVVLAASAYLLDAVYKIVQGICLQYTSSATTVSVITWAAVGATFLFIYRTLWKIK